MFLIYQNMGFFFLTIVRLNYWHVIVKFLSLHHIHISWMMKLKAIRLSWRCVGFQSRRTPTSKTITYLFSKSLQEIIVSPQSYLYYTNKFHSYFNCMWKLSWMLLWIQLFNALELEQLKITLYVLSNLPNSLSLFLSF